MSSKQKSLIDESNEKLWESRFTGTSGLISKAEKLIIRSEKINYQEGIARARLNIAAAYFYSSDTKSAIRRLTEALKILSVNREDKWYIRALLVKGNIHESFGDYESTLKFWLEALKISESINDPASVGEASSQLGLVYTRLCNFTKALSYFHKGLTIREELGDENAVASSLNRIGMVLRQTGKYEDSLEHYRRSLAIREKNNQLQAIPWTLLGIGNTLEDMKNYSEALVYYEKGLGGGDKRCSLQCLLGSGRIHSKLGDKVLAEERLLKSLEMAKELRSFVLISEVYSALSSNYERFGLEGKALKYFKLFLKARESFQSGEVQSRLSNLEIAHAIEKTENEKEIYRLRHVELKQAYDIIEEYNRDIKDSIKYASRIQKAILPGLRELPELERNTFILYLPKDIVSGDFYWFTCVDDKIVIAAADCTGHGVPGALMSMLGITFLNEIVAGSGITDPAKILDLMTKDVRKALKQKGDSEETHDGMDITLCTIDKKEGLLSFAGAHNNLVLIRKGKLTEYDADRMPVGYHDDPDRKFTLHKINAMKGDQFYLSSDGFADQFGGPKNKRLKSSAYKELLLKHHRRSLPEQKKALEAEFIKWKGSYPQTDDVLVIGYKF